MSLFDWYRPQGQLRCPIDGHPLKEWQGKDGPCSLFVWQEGGKHPVDQLIDDEEVRSHPAEWNRFVLPPVFQIYSYDCPRHKPVEARCSTHDDIWDVTAVKVPTLDSR